ncbi:retrovirus-related pol polyprotein from transposon tnt 1-94 [Cucumis melo var. makuwa]|uniref:Retrovirus-related pol polyprotein from transposon tnt 1-94 n=1 Tax=Cucumis melo var. makuwa TaxID=1194695 RepID=A0A5D3DSP8_CUCMM|nr:retrovirus-related pol polyprotein from transposon tnt 1-94 [Cucumis melo var. makuwa]
MVRSIMSFAQLPDSFWGYALETPIYILNNVPSKSVSETPYELWKGRKAQIIIPDDGIEDSLTYKQAMNDVDCNQWIKVMDLEMESIYSNSVWSLVDQPNDVKPIGCKWIYKRKRDQAGKVQTFKAQLVAKAACEAAKEAVWLKKFVTDLEVIPNMQLPITLYCDNSGAVANSREPRSLKREKHIERKYHLIREIVHRGDVIVTKISSEQNMADPFTKALTAKVFESDVHGLGLRDL